MTNTNRTAAANTLVSARVLALIANGANPLDALRTVCGAAIVNAMISDLYDTLRKEAA